MVVPNDIGYIGWQMIMAVKNSYYPVACPEAKKVRPSFRGWITNESWLNQTQI